MVTLKEIAKRCNVSEMTVSKVLNGKIRGVRGDSAKRAAGIRKVAEQMGYRPNTAARAMALGRYHAIGFVQSRIKRGNAKRFPNVSITLAEQLAVHHFHLISGLVPVEDIKRDEVPRILRELMVDGLIVDYVKMIPPRLKRLIENTRVPSVWLNARLDSACVYPDDFNAAHAATVRLIEAGHRRITYVSMLNDGEESHYSQRDRRCGYEKAMREAGRSAEVLQHGEESMGGLRRDLEKVLSRKRRPTAILAYDDREAYVTVTAALSKGLQVPRDLSIIGFNDEPLADTGILIDTMLIPAEEMARQAVEFLVESVEKKKPLPAISLPHTYSAGESIASPPKT